MSKSVQWARLALTLWRRGWTRDSYGRRDAAMRCIRAQTWY